MHRVDCCRLNKYIVILMANNKFFLSTPYSDEVYQNGTGKCFPLNCFYFILFVFSSFINLIYPRIYMQRSFVANFFELYCSRLKIINKKVEQSR